MRAGSRLSIATCCWLLVSAHSLAGCTDESSPTGEVSINLVGQTPSGAIYRLRGATIIVDGPNSRDAFHTDNDPDRTSLEANVTAGRYTASLQPGWRLELVKGGAATPIFAELLSANPVLFDVVRDQRTIVPLKFRAFGEDINLAQGYGVVIEVEQCTQQEAVCGDGIDNDCDGRVDCQDPNCFFDAVCQICGDGFIAGTEECEDGNTVDFDGCSRSCKRERFEVEPNEDGTPSISFELFTGNDFSTVHADLNEEITTSRTIHADLSPDGDEDVFRIGNPSNRSVSVQLDTWSRALGIGSGCGEAFNTVLVTRDAASSGVVFNDDRNGPLDRCSSLSRTIPAGSHIYVQVTDFGDDSAVLDYALQVTFTPN